MVKRLVEHVAARSPEEIAGLSLQDMGLCMTFYEACLADAEAKERWSALPRAAVVWASQHNHGARRSEGRRTQWLLRDLIDILEAEGPESLAWDECGFLGAVYALSRKASQSSDFERPRSLLQPYIRSLEARKTALQKKKSFRKIERRITIVSEEDIQAAKPREIQVFAGIDMVSRGPVLVLRGHAQVLNAVPENCTLVVEAGSCSVEGFVLGRLAVSGHCDVRDSIAGSVVAKEGDIRARKIIDKALVVAKQGRVHCRETHNPALIYAGAEILVRGPAAMGRYIAPRIVVDASLTGATAEVSRSLAADLVGHLPGYDARIVLRNHITCEDYGEHPDNDASLLMRRAYALERRIDGLETLLRQTEGEAEFHASTTIFFLCTSGSSQRHVENIQHAQRRLAILKRLMAGLKSLAAAAQDSIAQPNGEPSEETGSVAQEIEGEMRMFLSEGQLDHDLRTAMATMSGLKQKLDEARRSRKLLSSVLQRVRSQLESCVAEAAELNEEVEKSERELKAVLDKVPQLKSGQGVRTNVEILKRVVTTLASQSGALADKLRSPFAQLMLRNVRSRQEMAKKYRSLIQELESEYQSISTKLEKNYQIHVARGGEATLPFVRARFEAGVWIAGDSFALEAEEPHDAVLRTAEIADAPRIYHRLPTGAIAEEAPSQ